MWTLLFFLILINLTRYSAHWWVSFLSASQFHSHSTSFRTVFIDALTQFYNCRLRNLSCEPRDFTVYQSSIGDVQGFPGVCKRRPYYRRQWIVHNWWVGEIPKAHTKKVLGSIETLAVTKHSLNFLLRKQLKWSSFLATKTQLWEIHKWSMYK